VVWAIGLVDLLRLKAASFGDDLLDSFVWKWITGETEDGA